MTFSGRAARPGRKSEPLAPSEMNRRGGPAETLGSEKHEVVGRCSPARGAFQLETGAHCCRKGPRPDLEIYI